MGRWMGRGECGCGVVGFGGSFDTRVCCGQRGVCSVRFDMMERICSGLSCLRAMCLCVYVFIYSDLVCVPDLRVGRYTYLG